MTHYQAHTPKDRDIGKPNAYAEERAAKPEAHALTWRGGRTSRGKDLKKGGPTGAPTEANVDTRENVEVRGAQDSWRTTHRGR